MIQRKGAVNFILRVLCLLVAFACVTLLCWQYGVRRQGENANEAMRRLYDPAAGAEEALPEPQAAFSQLLAANPETVAYLDAAEGIEFAVVQRDNEYYLTHNFFGEDTPEGTAFLDEGNSIYPLDEHVLIHGHNMRDGSVFGDLDNFRELDFLKNNRSPRSTRSMKIASTCPSPSLTSPPPPAIRSMWTCACSILRRMRTFSTSPLRPRIAPSSISPWTSSAAITCSRW